MRLRWRRRGTTERMDVQTWDLMPAFEHFQADLLESTIPKWRHQNGPIWSNHSTSSCGNAERGSAWPLL